MMRVCIRVDRKTEINQEILTYTDTFTRSDEEIPQQSISINTEQDLIEFFNSDYPHAHLEADVELHRDYAGFYFAYGRVIDGRGYSVKLADDYATASVYEVVAGQMYIHLSGEANYDERYGLFVNVNDGEIKNIRFKFSSSVSLFNDGKAVELGLGVVCGENNGVIRNCDLLVSGSYEYYYLSLDYFGSEIFRTDFGGIAGINNGSITNIGAKYDAFSLKIVTFAQESSFTGELNIPAFTLAGGIIGRMTDGASCANIKICGRGVTYSLLGRGIDTDESKSYAGAVAAFGCADNVIVDFDVEYESPLSGAGEISKNAVVHVGQAVNVTALNAYGGEENLRSNNMSSKEDVEYCNYFDVGDSAIVQVNINYNNHQVIEVIPQGATSEVSFIKYKEENGLIAEDCKDYVNVPQNFMSQVIDGSIGMRVAAYQTEGKNYWELTVEESIQPPVLEVRAYDENGEYESGFETLSGEVKFIAQSKDGIVEYRLDSGNWQIYTGEITLSASAQIEFRAVSQDSELTSDTILYIVNIIRETTISVTAQWFDVVSSKVYDGTDQVFGSVQLNMEYLETFQNYLVIKQNLLFSARYAQVNAGAADVIIDIWVKDGANFKLENNTVIISGVIYPKEITVSLEKSYAVYGLGEWQYNYTVNNTLNDDEVALIFDTDADRYSAPADSYRYWLAEKTYGNYTVSNFDELSSYECGAQLEIEKFTVTQLLFSEEIIGNAIEISFADANDGSVLYLLDVTYELLVNGVATAKQTIDEVGLYRITVSMPENLSDRYALAKDIEPIEVLITELSEEEIPDVEEPPDVEESGGEKIPPEEKDEDTNDTEQDESDELYYGYGGNTADALGGKAKTVTRSVIIIAVLASIGIGVGLVVKKKKVSAKPKGK